MFRIYNNIGVDISLSKSYLSFKLCFKSEIVQTNLKERLRQKTNYNYNRTCFAFCTINVRYDDNVSSRIISVKMISKSHIIKVYLYSASYDNMLIYVAWDSFLYTLSYIGRKRISYCGRCL